eukprot:7123767-Prymnesium_polylepis.1
MRQQECPICFEPMQITSGGLADGQHCPQCAHAICHACASHLVEPVPKERTGDAGLMLACPMCRARRHLGGLDMLALIMGWDR